jgi:long-subunit acyl-CoA synthetase (AMP-forming)
MLRDIEFINGKHMLRSLLLLRPSQEASYSQVTHLLIGLKHLGLCEPQEVDATLFKFLGILSKNREEWAMADLACLRSAITIVPFYESLGADAIAFIMN